LIQFTTIGSSRGLNVLVRQTATIFDHAQKISLTPEFFQIYRISSPTYLLSKDIFGINPYLH